jgi:hypothetical protein
MHFGHGAIYIFLQLSEETAIIYAQTTFKWVVFLFEAEHLLCEISYGISNII